MTSRLARLGLVAMVAFAAAACSDVAPTQVDTTVAEGRPENPGKGPKPAGSPTIVDIASGSDDFEVLTAAVTAFPEIAEALSGKRQYTVFAPTDDAFIALADFLAGEGTDITDEEGALGVLTGVPALKDILLYHVARGRRDAEDVLDSERIRTLNGGFVFPGLDEGGPFLIDGSGNRVAIDAPDVFASNGVVHVIGGVLLPGDEDPTRDEPGSIVDIASASEDFEILTAAVTAFPEIAEALSGKGKYTVFAPTDDAFIALADLLAGEGTEITEETPVGDVVEAIVGAVGLDGVKQVLLYHVARGRRDAEDVLDSERIRTLSRGFVFPGVDGEGPFLVDGTGARVAIVAPDVFASNGVIHVIGGVLLP